MNGDTKSGGSSDVVRLDVAAIGESALTLAEELLELILGSIEGDVAIHRLTVCSLLVGLQHARGSIAEFSADRPYSGLALDRCFYESVVRIMERNLDVDYARRIWKLLPILAAEEEARKIEERLVTRKGVVQKPISTSAMPPGVLRDVKTYMDEHPDLSGEERSMKQAEDYVWQAVNSDDAHRDRTVHYDIPSLFVHCRPLIAEDVIDIGDPEDWKLRETSRVGEANARILDIAALLINLCRFLAPRFGYDVSPVDLVQVKWLEALENHRSGM